MVIYLLQLEITRFSIFFSYLILSPFSWLTNTRFNMKTASTQTPLIATQYADAEEEA